MIWARPASYCLPCSMPLEHLLVTVQLNTSTRRSDLVMLWDPTAILSATEVLKQRRHLGYDQCCDLVEDEAHLLLGACFGALGDHVAKGPHVCGPNDLGAESDRR